jgi:hypothetical protein
MKLLLELLQESEWSGATRAYHKLSKQNASGHYRAAAMKDLGNHKAAANIDKKRDKISRKMYRAYDAIPQNPENTKRRNKRKFTSTDVVSGILKNHKRIEKYKEIFKNH